MTQAGPLRWRSGVGWIVLTGGGSWRDGVTGQVDAMVLGWADLSHPIAIIPSAGGSTSEANARLDYLADLGGPHGYVVPIYKPADAQRVENAELISGAGLVYLADGPDAASLVESLRYSPALAAISHAHEAGAAIVGAGAGATALGAWIAGTESTGETEGLGWVEDVIVTPHFEGAESADQLRHLLDTHSECIGLGIPEGSGLGLGPDGNVVSVGDEDVTVVVGQVEDDRRAG